MASSRGGRPKLGEGDRGTRQTRVFEDIADMVAWISRVKKVSAAQILDPMVRPQVAAMFKAIEPEVEAIKKADAALKKVEEAAAIKHRRRGVPE